MPVFHSSRDGDSTGVLGYNKHVPAAAEGKPSAKCSQVHRNKGRPTQELANGLPMPDVTMGSSLGESCAVLKVRLAAKRGNMKPREGKHETLNAAMSPS